MSVRFVRPTLLIGIGLILGLLTMAAPLMGAQGILATVQDRGKLVCGVHGSLPGFGYLESDGAWSGFDADFCRGVAAAVLGDSEAVDFIPLTAAERFVALQTGEVDVLIRNTTWTLTRDTEVGADFASPTFYDGQGLMVRSDLGVTELTDLAGASICVTAGTTTELNLADTMRAHGVPFTPVVFEESDTLYSAYEQGRCDAITSDKSQLAGRRIIFSNPDDHIIMEATISKEPLAPMTIHGDNDWNDIVSWVVYATFFAEEVGMTSQNVDSFYNTNNPDIARFLGTSGELGAHLGLRADWAAQVIRAVGNYGEIFESNLSPLGLPRGLNRQWTDGGVLYAMPFR